ncbi:MAG TPA: glycosyltransferase [Gemmatimonadaceae bacterium]|nr:glycosyltransferase [Gemmatimonadaceae bacterium]
MGAARPTSEAAVTTALPRVSVILPAYYSDSSIASCLEGLRAQTFRDFEVIVVNSSPEQRTAEIVTIRFPEVRFHQSATRLFPHAARNVGVSVANGDLIVFTDPDCVPRSDWLEALVEASKSSPVVQGSVDMRGKSWLARGVHLCKRGSLLKQLPAYTPWIVSSINVLYSREAWQAAGPLDGNLFCGDAVLGWRASARGYFARFEPSAVVENIHDETFGGLIRQRYARGREFAGARADYEKWTRIRALAFALACPALIATVLWRAGRWAAAGGQIREFVMTLPVQIAGHSAWILGETVHYASRAAA